MSKKAVEEKPEMATPDEETMVADGDVKNGNPKLTFENTILDKVGHFGPYQRWVFALLTMTDIPSGMAMLYFIFSNANPGTRCSIYEGNQTWSNNFTIGNEVACRINGTGAKCVDFEFDDKYTSIITEVSFISQYVTCHDSLH
jgi:hypothetical protein